MTSHHHRLTNQIGATDFQTRVNGRSQLPRGMREDRRTRRPVRTNARAAAAEATARLRSWRHTLWTHRTGNECYRFSQGALCPVCTKVANFIREACAHGKEPTGTYGEYVAKKKGRAAQAASHGRTDPDFEKDLVASYEAPPPEGIGREPNMDDDDGNAGDDQTFGGDGGGASADDGDDDDEAAVVAAMAEDLGLEDDL